MRHWRLISTVVAVAAFSAVITSQTPSGHAVFEQALAKERVEGNLLEAIRLYERVVDGVRVGPRARREGARAGGPLLREARTG